MVSCPKKRRRLRGSRVCPQPQQEGWKQLCCQPLPVKHREDILGQITIVPQEPRRQADYMSSRLPVRYMEDFTVLGFTVATFARALELLEDAGYAVTEEDGGAQVEIASAKDVQNIHTLFRAGRLAHEYRDLAETFYQA